MPLARLRHSIRVAKDPGRFDLIISDWTRAGAEEGPDLLERLRSTGHNLPYVFYVADASATRRARAAELGAVGIAVLPDELLKYALVELATAS